MSKTFSVLSFVAGIMFGTLLAGAWFAGLESSSLFSRLSPDTSQLKPNTREDRVPESGAISVADQLSGETVVVESVTVPPPGVWIAVREMNGAEFGNVLGAVRTNGPRTNLSIPLLRATEAGRDYAIQLYRDDGTGDFNPIVNSVYVDFDTGSRVVAYFKTID